MDVLVLEMKEFGGYFPEYRAGRCHYASYLFDSQNGYVEGKGDQQFSMTIKGSQSLVIILGFVHFLSDNDKLLHSDTPQAARHLLRVA